MKEGIYFNLPDDEYRAAPAMNYSSIKALLKSRLYYWVTNPELNPDYEKQEDSEAMLLGRAYHTRILEGEAEFRRLYAPKFISERDDLLVSSTDITARLKELGVKGYSGKRKAELIDMLVEHSPDDASRVLDILVAEYIKQNDGCAFLPLEWIKKIELSAQIIENDAHLSKCFKGGYPEVSIFWHDNELKADMKIRVDYLKTRATNDLKSFSNMNDKPFDTAMIHEVSNRKYFIQAALYLRGVEKAKQLASEGKFYGNVSEKWIEAFCASPAHDFTFIFQEKGIAPCASALTHSHSSLMNDSALMIIRQVMEDWHYCREKFGKAPWMDEREPITAADDDYPLWAWNV